MFSGNRALTASEKVHLPFDMLTALSRAEGRRCPSSLRYCGILVSTSLLKNSRALHLEVFSLPSDLWLFMRPSTLASYQTDLNLIYITYFDQ